MVHHEATTVPISGKGLHQAWRNRNAAFATERSIMHHFFVAICTLRNPDDASPNKWPILQDATVLRPTTNPWRFEVHAPRPNAA